MTFDPTNFNFRKLDYSPPEVQYYERCFPNMPESIKPDFLRLNTYLTTSGAYVTMWFGFIEPFMAESEFEKLTNVINFNELYNTEDLFKGMVDSDEIATVIFSSIFDPRASGSYIPQVLRKVGEQIQFDYLSET